MNRFRHHTPVRHSQQPAPALLWTALAVLVLFFATVLVRWPDNFFADDSYFYFQCASRFAHGQGSSFNSLMPTNGYHPLWFLVCAAILKVVPDHRSAVHVIGLTLSLLNLGALIRLTQLLQKAGTTLPYLAWLLYLPFCFTTQLGTEGALSGLFISATAYGAYTFAQTPTQRRALAYAICAALAVLSRLDNIFIVTALSAALALSVPQRRRNLALLAKSAPIPLLLWAAYLFTNHHFFGTFQPISGLLKAHSPGEHKFLTNLPRTAWFDLALIAAGLAITRRHSRDLFHRTVEVPFALGVLIHALYITFVLSSETRWSWYYTTWTLLAGILLARATSVLFDRYTARNNQPETTKNIFQTALFTFTYLTLLGIWSLTSLRHFAHNDPTSQDPGFHAAAVDRAHLHTLLAFDKPGRIAWYSNADIVPLDGLMGSLQFQHDLATKGIAGFDRTNRIDGFIGPPQPLNLAGKLQFCDAIFLSSVQFHCTQTGPNQWTTDRADIFARLTQTPAGSVPLAPANLVFNQPGYVAVWRLPQQP